jgi:hypothetical protein
MATAHCTPEADQDLIRIGTDIVKGDPTAALRWGVAPGKELVRIW